MRLFVVVVVNHNMVMEQLAHVVTIERKKEKSLDLLVCLCCLGMGDLWETILVCCLCASSFMYPSCLENIEA